VWGVARAGLIVAGAAALYLVCTGGLDALFARGVGPPTVSNNVAAQPGSMLAERLRQVRSLSDVLVLMPSRYYQEELVRSYHPAVLAAALAGVALLGPRVAVATLLGLAISLVSLTYYSTPWAATNVYPFVYIGAGSACAALGRFVARTLQQFPRRKALTLRSLDAARWLGVGVALASALLLAAQTNLDLVGNTNFLLTWFRYWEGKYIF